MNQVVLQPTGNPEARVHYTDTIENPVPLQRIQRFIDQDLLTRLSEIAQGESVLVWGVTPGSGEVNRRKWERMQIGDVVLFARKGRLHASATVAELTHNRDLAAELWGTNSKGETWEYVYFVDELKPQSIPYAALNEAAGYESTNVIQGFNVLNDEKSRSIVERFDLASSVYLPSVSESEYRSAVRRLGSRGALDVEGRTVARTEQAFLRRYLFKNKKTAHCGLCGREFPVSFLVAAHIKKRAECTIEEKLDFKHIVMPMCKLGCDELYERGYVVIQQGKVVAISKKDATPSIREALQPLMGRACEYWSEATSGYFDWHRRENS